MATFRIDIEGQTSPFARKRVQTVMPAGLSPYLPDDRWQQFTGDINKELDQMNDKVADARKLTYMVIVGLVLLSLSMFSVIPVDSPMRSCDDDDGYYDRRTGDFVESCGPNWAVMAILMILGMALVICGTLLPQRTIRKAAFELHSEIQSICEKASQENQGISVHLKDDLLGTQRRIIRTNYIEISVDTGAGSGAPMDATVVSIPKPSSAVPMAVIGVGGGFCTACGAQLSMGASFCGSCGAPKEKE